MVGWLVGMAASFLLMRGKLSVNRAARQAVSTDSGEGWRGVRVAIETAYNAYRTREIIGDDDPVPDARRNLAVRRR